MITLRPNPGHIIQTLKSPSVLSVSPRCAVKVPNVYSKPITIIPQSIKPVVQRSTKIAAPKAFDLKRKPVQTLAMPQAVVRQSRKSRLPSDARASNLRKVTDAILTKHNDKIKGLRGIGNGRLLAIISCGPSVNQAAIEKLAGNKHIDIMCINKPDLRVWPSKYWIFCDQSQYNRNQESWASYVGTVINASSVKASHPNQILVRTIAGKGFSRDLTRGFHIGRSTTYASMQVALYMGYEKIYIFGCDMCAVDGKLHRYGQNPDVSNENRIQRFNKEAEHYDWAVGNLKDYEMSKFVFCSSYNQYSFTKKFERIDQKEAVDQILVAASKLVKDTINN